MKIFSGKPHSLGFCRSRSRRSILMKKTQKGVKTSPSLLGISVTSRKNCLGEEAACASTSLPGLKGHLLPPCQRRLLDPGSSSIHSPLTQSHFDRTLYPFLNASRQFARQRLTSPAIASSVRRMVITSLGNNMHSVRSRACRGGPSFGLMPSWACQWWFAVKTTPDSLEKIR